MDDIITILGPLTGPIGIVLSILVSLGLVLFASRKTSKKIFFDPTAKERRRKILEEIEDAGPHDGFNDEGPPDEEDVDAWIENKVSEDES